MGKPYSPQEKEYIGKSSGRQLQSVYIFMYQNYPDKHTLPRIRGKCIPPKVWYLVTSTNLQSSRSGRVEFLGCRESHRRTKRDQEICMYAHGETSWKRCEKNETWIS